jgi:hypothetical protein
LLSQPDKQKLTGLSDDTKLRIGAMQMPVKDGGLATFPALSLRPPAKNHFGAILYFNEASYIAKLS